MNQIKKLIKLRKLFKKYHLNNNIYKTSLGYRIEFINNINYSIFITDTEITIRDNNNKINTEIKISELKLIISILWSE